jgi:hypothetical protein
LCIFYILFDNYVYFTSLDLGGLVVTQRTVLAIVELDCPPFFSKEGQELFHSFKVERKNKVTVTAQILTSKVQHYSTPGSVPKQKVPGHGEATRLSNEKHILARAATSFVKVFMFHVM